MNSRRTVLCSLAVFLLLILPTRLEAQLNRGQIEGIVTDPQGAVIPDVAIAITNVDTNITVSGRTNNAGLYRVLDLVPGKYQARYESSGFSILEMKDIEIPAGKVTRLDVELQLAGTRQLIEVTSEAPVLETAANNYSTTLEMNVIQSVPLQGRDLTQLVFMLPGVTNVGGPPGSNFGFSSQYGTFPDPTNLLGSAVAVNGGQGGANAWYLDGNFNVSGFGENISVNPSPDAVSEFQAITNAFSAEYGHTGGGVFNVVLKSGTNKFHGNVYEFLRNDATNARNPFTSIDSQGQLIKDRQLRFNNFGGTLGGPVVVPGLFNGKDRTFFFFSWDTSILHLLGNQTFSVPTARMRRGDFSEDPNVVANGLYDPYSSVGPDADGLFQRQPFRNPDGSMTTAIPANRLDPVANYFVKSFPLPNHNSPLSGCPMGADGYKICDNFLGTVGSSQVPHNISIKIDHQWSQKSKYFFEWLYNPGSYNNYRVPWTGASFPFSSVGYGSNYPLRFRNQVFALGNTHTFNPTVVNEFRASFSRQYITTLESQYPDSITDESGVVQLLAPSRIPQDPPFRTPQFTIYSPGWMSFGPQAWVNMTTAAEAYTFLDNLTKIKGRHTIKAGFMYRLEHGAYVSGFPTVMDFSGGLTADPITGLGGTGLAQFMMGAVSSGDYPYTGRYTAPYTRWRSWGFYVQDDFRLTPRFSLNLGLRYDLNGFYRDRRDPMSNFCFDCLNEQTGLKGKLVYSGDPAFPKGDIMPANKNSIAPRVNFAWSPFSGQKTVLRGGYDIFYTNALGNMNAPGQSAINAKGWQQYGDWRGSFYPDKCAPFSGQCVAFTLSDTTTDKSSILIPPLTPGFPAEKRQDKLGGDTYSFTKPPRDPMVQSWTLELQHEIRGTWVFSLGYAGSRGTHLAGDPFTNFNYIPTKDKLQYRTKINENRPISEYYSGQTAEQLAQVFKDPLTGTPASELPRSTLLLPFPFYPSGVWTQTTFHGTTIYNGMNLRVQKRYSHGLDFIAAYTFSKKINNWATGQAGTNVVDPIHWARNGTTGGRSGVVSWSGGFGGSYQDPDNRRVDRAIAADDIPQMLNVTLSYALPFGSGKAFFNRKGNLNALLGGWKLTSTFNAQSGIPLPITGPCNEMTCRPNLVGDPKFSGNRTKEQRIQQWINPAAFQPVFGNDETFWNNYDPTDDRAWLFGTAGPRLPGIRSPGFWNLDAALAKDFHLAESRYFQFRWEVFNALNHQNLGFPDTNFCLPPGPEGAQNSVRYEGCQFGRITNIQTDPRSMQFALKFNF